MKTLDLKKQFAPYYKQKRGIVSIVDVPPSNFLMIDGRGDPNTAPEFHEALETLYALSYTLKFMLKMDRKAYDYPVMPLEGLWWSADGKTFDMDRRRDWRWTVMILQPDVITPALLAEAQTAVRKKKNPAALGRERLERFHEGLAAQVLHIGPYAAEGPTIAQMHEFIRAKGYGLRGKHHEVYFGDPRRANPANLKTILRQPVATG